MIDDFVREFTACLIGTAREKSEWAAELRAHLEEAQDNNDLEKALDRLGSPRHAAASFRSGRPLAPAPLKVRWLAQAIDHIPLLIVVIGVAVQQVRQGTGGLSVAFPPSLLIASGRPILWNLGVPVALLWSWAGLALIEALTHGRTPGKAILHLRAVSAEGTTISLGQSLKRRASILLGGLVWIDWAAAFFTQRSQRLLDLLANSMVISDLERMGADDRSRAQS